MSEQARARGEAQGCANIALIKYMGKRDADGNIASNPSVSYTLPHLKTTVTVSGTSTGPDRWEFLADAGGVPMGLTPEGERRFLGYVRKLCDLWDYPQSVVVRSANNFPADAGIASSASSFCGATRAVAAFLRRHETVTQLAQLSRTGSGSSCRSFFDPWCMWDGDSIHALAFPVGRPMHMVVIVDGGRKTVSSSDAHVRVASSPRFPGRADRARARMNQPCRHSRLPTGERRTKSVRGVRGHARSLPHQRSAVSLPDRRVRAHRSGPRGPLGNGAMVRS
jgi:diphosphomevalonate decarboxylase